MELRNDGWRQGKCIDPTHCSALAADESAVNVFMSTKLGGLLKSPSRPKDLLSTK